MSSKKMFVPIMAIKGPLSDVRHNIKHYEDMHEYDITPESRKVTLDDLREIEAICLKAIEILSNYEEDGTEG